MNPSKFLVLVNDFNQIEEYKKARITNFLFPLKNFSVGFEKTFSIFEIPEGYLYINRILDQKAYESLKNTLKNLKKEIKGIVFEDFGVITIAKELKLNQQLILFQTHFATNKNSINENLKFVDSVVIGTDITKEEIDLILENSNKPLVYYLYGLVPGMYSRRTLLTNFEHEFQLSEKKIVKLEEQITKKEFIAVENDYGTILYYGKYLNGQGKIDDTKILFYFINPLFLNAEEQKELIADLINQKKRESIHEDEGFLNTKTIYRLKEDQNE